MGAGFYRAWIADSGSAYRGSNPWGAAKSSQTLTVLETPLRAGWYGIVPTAYGQTVVTTRSQSGEVGSSATQGRACGFIEALDRSAYRLRTNP
jgi:hypothetical protein